MKHIRQEALSLFLVAFGTVGGFFVGKTQVSPVQKTENQTSVVSKNEVSVVELVEVSADTLQVVLPENTRLVWSEGKNAIDTAGLVSVPLGQVDTVDSKKFWSFPYVGNAKTRKFYPSRSYPARGTELRYRRFFVDKKSALAAGFIASKLVK